MLLQTTFITIICMLPVDSITCPEHKVFAHPLNCNTFYRCDENGKANHIFCPEGLHFNADLETCDWPSNANCTVATAEVGEEEREEESGSDAEIQEMGFVKQLKESFTDSDKKVTDPSLVSEPFLHEDKEGLVSKSLETEKQDEAKHEKGIKENTEVDDVENIKSKPSVEGEETETADIEESKNIEKREVGETMSSKDDEKKTAENNQNEEIGDSFGESSDLKDLNSDKKGENIADTYDEKKVHNLEESDVKKISNADEEEPVIKEETVKHKRESSDAATEDSQENEILEYQRFGPKDSVTGVNRNNETEKQIKEEAPHESESYDLNVKDIKNTSSSSETESPLVGRTFFFRFITFRLLPIEHKGNSTEDDVMANSETTTSGGTVVV